MVNRNSARHLALIASVLLCFFVYIGYRLRGGGDATRDDAGSPLDAAILGDGVQSPTSLITLNDSPSGGQPSVRVPVATPTGSPPSLRNGEAAPDIASSFRPDPDERSGGSRLRPPGGAAAPSGGSALSGMPPPPSGSIEESRLPTPAGNNDNIITGLIPDAVVMPPAAEASGGASMLPAPPLDSAPAGGLAQRDESGARPANGETPGGGLSLPPPPADSSSSSRPPEPTVAVAPERSARGVVAPPAAVPAPPADRPSEPERTSSPSRTGMPPPSTRPGNGAAGGSSTPLTPPAPAGQLPGGRQPPETTRIYLVRPGDTLSRIAIRELGSIALADNIFLMNTEVITDPNHLTPGMRLLLPARKDDAGQTNGYNGGVIPDSRPAPGRQAQVHVVARGDTLSGIALRYYGSSTAWRFLYEVNANTIANPNRLVVGTQLLVPPYGEKPEGNP